MINLNSEEFIVHLQDSLKFVQVNRLRTSVTIRCPYCGDSSKTLNKGHLNIKIDDPSCFLWRCVRCGMGGIVNYKFIKDIECYDPVLVDISMKNNLNAKEYFRTRKKEFRELNLFGNRKEFKVNFNDDSLSQEKLEYVCDRLHVNISPKLSCKLKMITNFHRFLDENKLPLTEDIKLINTLQEHGVGFLSWDNSMIIFRNIHGKFFDDKRYYNYNVFGRNQINSNKFFSIKKNIDIMSPIFKINLTEGIFDILGLAFSSLKDELKERNSLMISCNGQSYANIMNVIASLGFVNLEVRFFSDRDVKKEKFIKLKEKLIILKNNETRLFYNKLEKDYGIPSDRIDLQEFKL